MRIKLFEEYVNSKPIADEKLEDELGIEDKELVDRKKQELDYVKDIISFTGFTNSLYTNSKSNIGKQNLSTQAHTNISGQNGK